MRVLVDTSFLMLMAERGRNLLELAEEALEERIEALVLEDALAELRTLAGRVGKRAMKARAALKVAERMGVLRVQGAGRVDEKLLQAAESLGLVLATADSELAREARRRRIPVLMVRRDMSVWLEGART